MYRLENYLMIAFDTTKRRSEGGSGPLPEEDLIKAVLKELPDFKSALPASWSLLDFPDHSNVGDAAIWLGTIELLGKQFGRPPSYVTSHRDLPDDLDRKCPEGPVFLHGGGNFGDLWGGFWQKRVTVLKRYRHRRIIQLPQTIAFLSDPMALAETRAAIASHPDFTLLVRDHASLSFARANFDCPVHLSPDFAFGLGHLPRPVEAQSPCIALMRGDEERRDEGETAAILSKHMPVCDWITSERPARTGRWATKLAQSVPLLRAPLNARIAAGFDQQARWQLQRGCSILAQGEKVITDRLHAHILCRLMRIPQVVLDNSYGKIFGYMNSWPSDPLSRQAGTAQEAIERLTTLS